VCPCPRPLGNCPCSLETPPLAGLPSLFSCVSGRDTSGCVFGRIFFKFFFLGSPSRSFFYFFRRIFPTRAASCGSGVRSPWLLDLLTVVPVNFRRQSFVIFRGFQERGFPENRDEFQELCARRFFCCCARKHFLLLHALKPRLARTGKYKFYLYKMMGISIGPKTKP
jgi:hypothetical protein